MSTDVGRDPTVEQHQVNVLMEVSSPTVRLLKEELGRGPMGAPTQLAETDAFLGILDGALTSAERTRREPRPQLSPSAPVPAPAPWSDAPARTQRRARTPNLTVVVPTRDEAANVGRLLRELGDALTGEDAEVLFVDDSDDETPDVIREHVGGDLPVALLHRAPGERDGGLGGAVAEGLRAAKGRFVCVMDGDLQHPPQLVRKLLAEAETSGADVVVASRYVEQGDLGQFGALRRAVSRASTTLARAAFPRRLRGVTDPMSGFFLIRRGHVDAGVLRPDGFKILLEVLVRHAGTLREVPFAFGTRHAGDSKASYREGLRFLRHLLRLRLGDRGTRMAGFAAVGASGVAVNTAALAALLSLGGAHVLVWSFVATQVAIVWNFSLSERWVFRGQQVGLWSRLSSYTALNNASFALSGPLLMALITIAALPVLLANVVSLGVLAIVRFVISDRLIWRATSSAPQPPARVAVLLPVTRTRDDACVAA